MTLSSVESCLVEDITKEFIFDFTQPATIPQNSLGITTEINELVFESVFMAIKAVYSESIGKRFQTNLTDNQEVITEIAKDFEKENKFVINSIHQIPKKKIPLERVEKMRAIICHFNNSKSSYLCFMTFSCQNS